MLVLPTNPLVVNLLPVCFRKTMWFLIFNIYDIQRCLILRVFLFNVQGTRSQRAMMLIRRADFLTEQIR